MTNSNGKIICSECQRPITYTLDLVGFDRKADYHVCADCFRAQAERELDAKETGFFKRVIRRAKRILFNA